LVSTNQGDFVADFVVVAIPLGVLKANSVAFKPALPVWKLQAIKDVNFGIANKVVLRFKECFWDPHIDWLCYAQPLNSSSPPGEFAWIQNYYRFNKDPILVGFVENYYSASFSQLPDQEQLDHALALLEKRYGKPVRQMYVDGFVTHWDSDEFSRGSWSWCRIGAAGEDFDTLAKPVWSGLVRFAGEHTNRQHHSSVSGAYGSGVREAHAIGRMIRKRNKQQQ